MNRYPGQDLVRSEGFGDVITSANREGLEDLIGFRYTGDEDDRDGRRFRLAFEYTTGFQPVASGHHDVQNHEVRMLPAYALHRLKTVIRRKHFVTGPLQRSGEGQTAGRLVIDYQNSGGRVHGGALSIRQGKGEGL